MEPRTVRTRHQLRCLGLPLRRVVLLVLARDRGGDARDHELEHRHVRGCGDLRDGLLHLCRQTPLRGAGGVAQARVVDIEVCITWRLWVDGVYKS